MLANVVFVLYWINNIDINIESSTIIIMVINILGEILRVATNDYKYTSYLKQPRGGIWSAVQLANVQKSELIYYLCRSELTVVHIRIVRCGNQLWLLGRHKYFIHAAHVTLYLWNAITTILRNNKNIYGVTIICQRSHYLTTYFQYKCDLFIYNSICTYYKYVFREKSIITLNTII